MKTKGKLRKLRGMLRGTGALKSLITERARDRAKEDAALDPKELRDGGLRRVTPDR
jgi:hypothetical protein